MTDHTTHDLAIARAERDDWQSTCEELHPAIAALADECERLRATALCHSAARADLYTAYLAAKGDPTLREALRAFFKATEE